MTVFSLNMSFCLKVKNGFFRWQCIHIIIKRIKEIFLVQDSGSFFFDIGIFLLIFSLYVTIELGWTRRAQIAQGQNTAISQLFRYNPHNWIFLKLQVIFKNPRGPNNLNHHLGQVGILIIAYFQYSILVVFKLEIQFQVCIGYA